MKKLIILIISLLPLVSFADRIFIGIKQTASTADKNLLADLIVEKLDKQFLKSQAVKYWEKTDHTKVYVCNNWDLNNINIRSNLTAEKAKQWLDNNAGLFDNRADIATVDAVPSTWEHVSEPIE